MSVAAEVIEPWAMRLKARRLTVELSVNAILLICFVQLFASNVITPSSVILETQSSRNKRAYHSTTLMNKQQLIFPSKCKTKAKIVRSKCLK